MSSLKSQVLPPLILIASLALIAEGLIRLFAIPPYLFPGPLEVLGALYLHPREIFSALTRTALASMLGLMGSALIGAVFALLLSLNDWLRRAFYPLMVFFQTVPIIAIAPLMVIWVGYGLPSVTLSAFLVSVSPIIANALQGLLSVDSALLDLFRLHRASRFTTLLKLRIPSAVPSYLTGLRIAAGLAVIGAIVGEFVADTYEGGGGIGTLILIALKEQETALVFAAIFGSTLLGLLFFSMVGLLSHLALKWLHLDQTRPSA